MKYTVVSFFLAISLSLFAGAPNFTEITTGAFNPEGAGSISVSWGDYDNDGFQDLFVGNSHEYGNNYRLNFLYHNNGDGTFTKVTAEPPASDTGWSTSGAWGDYDNDGDLDLYVTNGAYGVGEANFFYANNGNGTFVKKTGLGDITDTPRLSYGSSWVDYDLDGDLDLFTTNNYAGVNVMYRNNGNDSFTTISAASLMDHSTYEAEQAWSDFDNDGDLDLAIPMGSQTNIVINNGDGSFTRTAPAGPASQNPNQTLAWGDYDNDGDMDLFTGGSSSNALFRNEGNNTWTKMAPGYLATDGGALDAQWVDWDLDGDLDIVMIRRLNASYNNVSLYENLGNGTFQGYSIGQQNLRLAGVAFADYDNDGDPDLAVTNSRITGYTMLFRNNSSGNNWFQLKLVGATNHTAIGARVQVTATIGGQSVTQIREVAPGGYGGQNTHIPMFGLGDATVIDEVRIFWPSGLEESLTNVATNQCLNATEGDNPDVDPANTPTAVPGTSVIDGVLYLDGSYSMDPQALSLSMNWSLDDGAYSYQGTLVDISGLAPGNYEVTLTVDNGQLSHTSPVMPLGIVAAGPQAPANPYVYYPFDEGFGAISASNPPGPDGTLISPSWTTGVSGAALQFDGTDYMTAFDNFGFEQSDSFSFSAWIKRDSADRMVIMSKMLSSGTFAGWLFWVQDNKLSVILRNDWKGGVNPDVLQVATDDDLPLGAWVHVAATYDGSGTAAGVQLFIDGSQKTTNSRWDQLSGSIATPADFNVGARDDGATGFIGAIDEVRIYDRTLSIEEVMNLFLAH